MKFGHLLQTFEADAAQPDQVCLNYKKLKKLIKAQTKHQKEHEGGEAAAVRPGVGSSDEEDTGLMPVRATEAAAAAAAAAGAAPANGGDGEQGDAAGGVAEEDREFIATLNDDLSRINAYFMEREEDAVIRLRALEDALAGGGDTGVPHAELEQLRNHMVDFHGELVLLLHWSLVNYAAVAKILKKHDKLTGSRLRAPVLASVLHQPFLSTESISQLVKEAERHVQELTQLCGGSCDAASGGGAGTSAAETAAAGRGGDAAGACPDPEVAMEGSHVAIFKRTRAALHMLNDMQATAHTPSTLLPAPVPGAGSAAHSDAAADHEGGKKQRTSGEMQQAAHQQAAQQQVAEAAEPQ